MKNQNINQSVNRNAKQLQILRHSAAHLLAQAVVELYSAEGPVHLGVGPPIADGFYYDFALPRPISEADLPKIEARMRQLIAADLPFRQQHVPIEVARRIFAGQPFKLELIDEIAAGSPAKVSLYQQGDHIDLCRGPHLPSSSHLNPQAFKLLSVAGAYWRSDSSRPMLVRIYGAAFASPADLKAHLAQLRLARENDHRRLGKVMELFHFDPSAPAMPYWLPKGQRLMQRLLAFWREEHESRGYQEISAPQLNSAQLWKISGHWDHYRDEMFMCPSDPADGREDYALKPMNCPNAMVVYKLKRRSYRQLPMRLSDCDVLHRNEPSGARHGLLRVQNFMQDDAHIFLAPDQIPAEIHSILDIAERFYGVFALPYSLRLSLRPPQILGDPAQWDQAEAILRSALCDRFGKDGFAIAEGEGAFYGPKIDIIMRDSLKRSWQMGSIQLDMQLPARFDCHYIDAQGHNRRPALIHRVIYGSFERFIGILLEHFAGRLPLWLSPVHIRLLPVSSRCHAHARSVLQRLQAAGLLAELDDGPSRLNAKIRQAHAERIPLLAIIGERESAADSVSLRRPGHKALRQIAVAELISGIQANVASKELRYV